MMSIDLSDPPGKFHGLPMFLRQTPEEHAARMALPWQPTSAESGFNVAKADPEREAAAAKLKADAEAEKAAAAEAKRERDRLTFEAEGRKGAASLYEPGMVWSPARGRFMWPDEMTPDRYARIMRELPTDAHRKIFVELYGPSLGASLGTPGAEARVEIPAATGKAMREPSKVGVESGSKPGRPTSGEAVAVANAPPPRAPTDKLVTLVTMLDRPEGATLEEIGAATGWLKHTASARVSGVRKTKTVDKVEEEGRGGVYRIRKDPVP